MKKILLNIAALIWALNVFGQRTDGFFTQQEYVNRDSDAATLNMQPNNFGDPASLNDGLFILLALVVLYIITRSFINKDTKI